MTPTPTASEIHQTPIDDADTMLRLIYVSKGKDGLSSEDFSEILAEARERNEQVAITGALCYRHGYFAQILEGPEAAVRETYAAIGGDSRHSGPVVIQEEQTMDRLYADWRMRRIDDRTATSAADELVALKRLADRHDTPNVTSRWFDLLQSSSRPVWAQEWLASKQSMLLLREHLELSAKPARASVQGALAQIG